MYDNSYNFYSNFRTINQEENQMRIKQKSKNKYYRLFFLIQ